MLRMPSLLLAAAAVLTLAACVPAPSADGDLFVPDTSVAQSATPTPTPTPTAPPAPVIPGPQLPGVDPAGYMTGILGQGVEFNSPSGNIRCGIYDGFGSDSYYGCSILDYRFEDPEPTGAALECSQNVAYGGGFYASLSGDDTPAVLCRGGAMFGGEAGSVGVLAYGTSLSYAGIVCESYEDYTGCRSLVNGHGFTLARGEYTVF